MTRNHEADAGQKGLLGEEFYRAHLQQHGVPFRAERFSDKVDFFQIEDKQRYWIEVKTQELWEPTNGTGIDMPLYKKYLQFLIDQNISKDEVKFVFVDWRKAQIYGNWWSVLERPFKGRGEDNVIRKFPYEVKYTTGHKRMYHYGQMEIICELSPQQCEKLRKLTHTKPYVSYVIHPNPELSPFDLHQLDFFDKRI